jgi:uncharacterized protein
MAKMEMPEYSEAIMSPGLATADQLFEMGLRYCASDYVTAHKWFNLAALKGSLDAKSYRCELAREMSPTDIAEAQRQARAWLTVH